MLFRSRHRHQRRAPASSVLAGVKTIGAQRVRDQIHIIFAASACVSAFPFALRALCQRSRNKRATLTIQPPSFARCDAACNQSAIAVKICSESTTAFSARCKCGGRFFPRFSARRRMPAQARGLK